MVEQQLALENSQAKQQPIQEDASVIPKDAVEEKKSFVRYDGNYVPVGSKPAHVYLNAVRRAFMNSREVYVMGRGRFISKAADVALISVEKNVKQAVISDIKVKTEAMSSQHDKRPVNVSSIVFTLKIQN